MGNGFKALDLGNQPRLVLKGLCRHIAELARHFHVGGIFGKAHGHIVSLKRHGGFDVFHVFGGQRRGGQSAALLVDAFVIGQLAAHFHRGVHLLAFDGVNSQHNQAVVQQQQVAGFDIAGQLFVVQSHALQITQFGA